MRWPAVDERVAVHPGVYLRINVYGTVTKLGRKYVHIRLDANDRTIKLHPSRVRPAESHDYYG